MKKLLVIGITLILISCSGTEQTNVEDSGCFSAGSKTYKWTMVTTWP